MQAEKSQVRMLIRTDDSRTQLHRQHIQSNGFTLEHTVPRSGPIHFQVMSLKIWDHAREKRIYYGFWRMLTWAVQKLTWAIKHIALQMPISNEVVQLASEYTPLQSYIDYWSEFWVSAICQLNENYVVSFSFSTTCALRVKIKLLMIRNVWH